MADETAPDPRERYGRIVHEIRLAFAAEMDRPFIIARWVDRDERQQELDMRIGEAVAAAERERAELGRALDRAAEAERRLANLRTAYATLRSRSDERDRLISALIAEHPVELGRFAQMAAEAADPPEADGQLPFPGVLP